MKSCLTIILTALLFIACNKQKEFTPRENPSNFRYRESIVDYMSQPEFVSKDFVQQITGTEAQLQLFDMDEMMLYFSINKKDFDSAATLNKLTINPERVQFGIPGDGIMILGEFILKGTERFLFRFPKDDFIIDSTRLVKIQLGSFTYTVSVKELADFAENFSINGNRNDAETRKDIYIADHGAFVSIKNEPSLMRLTEQIVHKSDSKEVKAQKLLDFVTSNIKFSQIEAIGGYEVLKRPNEIIMTGKSDCSGLTILYASLLEQIDADYLIVYYPGHINVAVNGNFSVRNNQKIINDNKTYVIAETTVKGFIIGETMLEKDFTVNQIKYIQKPGKDSKINKFQME
jgi:hypothetical protein